eukprot:6200023-Pleurochrysis_carterae.AAC.4
MFAAFLRDHLDRAAPRSHRLPRFRLPLSAAAMPFDKKDKKEKKEKKREAETEAAAEEAPAKKAKTETPAATAAPSGDSGARVYLGNLPWTVSEEQVSPMHVTFTLDGLLLLRRRRCERACRLANAYGCENAIARARGLAHTLTRRPAQRQADACMRAWFASTRVDGERDRTRT